MFKSYLRAAWRNLIQKKANSLMNIGGLSIGMAATLLIGMWLYDEISYNTNFENYESIAQVMQTQNFSGEVNTGSNQPMQLAPVLRNQYGNHFKHVVTSTFSYDLLMTVEETKVSRPGYFMEPGITAMLSLKMLQGPRSALEDPSSIPVSYTHLTLPTIYSV